MRELGTVSVTATVWKPVDAKRTTGQYSSEELAFRLDRSVDAVHGQRTWNSADKHDWNLKIRGVCDSGARTFANGTLELSSMSVKGRVYAID
ncbi:MAG: hypothetical protein AAF384_12330 [Pseudomonadota bacterium]